ncbi:hypothetical protein MIMGU_mgv1a019043mg, partial [Erythranthe guttata]
ITKIRLEKDHNHVQRQKRENTDSLPYDLIIRLVEATPSLIPPFRALLSQLIDAHADVAHEFGVFHLIFSPTGGFGMASYCSAWLNLPHRFTRAAEFLLPNFPEAGTIHVTQLTPAMLAGGDNNPLTISQHMNYQLWLNSDGLLLNTVEEIDNLGLTHFRRKLGLPVWAIGTLFLLEEDRASTISASQITKLAKALDEIRQSFIWVVRPPLGFDIKADKWAPQLKILAHETVGAFISHCEWNSLLEATKYGVPVIGWPMGANQFYSAKFLVEEAGVCIEVGRGTKFDVPKEDILEKIQMVMGENGDGIRKRCVEIKNIITNAIRDEKSYRGSSVKAVVEFFTAALFRKGKII